MAERQLISLDLETTGTDVERHEVWEVGLVYDNNDFEEWQFPIDLGRADPGALQINGFYERATQIIRPEVVPPHRTTQQCLDIAAHTVNAHFLGCAISFDMKFLEKLLRDHRVCPAWHHRALDLGSYAAAKLGEDFPLSSSEMQKRVANDSAHTALGDAQWNWSAYNWFKNYKKIPQPQRSTG